MKLNKKLLIFSLLLFYHLSKSQSDCDICMVLEKIKSMNINL